MNIRVLIVDDHSLVRAGLRSLLSGMNGVVVSGEAADGREAVALAESLHADIVLMDISMGGLNGLVAAEQICAARHDCRIIILSMHTDEEYAKKALKIGARGYLVKDSSTSELETAIRTVARGEIYLSPVVATPLIERYADLDVDIGQSEKGLTPRHREVLQLIAEGRTTKEIAATLNIGVKTVETYRTQLMERLNVHRIADLVRYAIRTGLVNPES
ncbi:MAG TPA: response regulator transcription factor [Spirochaetia bacterium]|nr:response regulator transcription factor [Spirochaetia bacterium]